MKMKSLEADAIGFTRKSCTGYGVDSNAYLFWKKDSITMMQKIEFIEYPKENVNEYNPMVLKDVFFFKTFFKHQEKIISNSELKRFRLDSKDTNEYGEVRTAYPMTSHSCYRLIRIKTQEIDFSKGFDYFKLAKSLGHSEDELNSNYDFNADLEIIKYDQLINSQIEIIEGKMTFELDKT
jgi:hypothetical protein